MKKIRTIAIDGPAGVGKSTVAKLVAGKTGFGLLETGAIYRAITVNFITKNLPFDRPEILAKAVENIEIMVAYTPHQRVFVEGVDLTPFLRAEVVENKVALVSKVPEVRQRVRELQRKITEQASMVVEGRDIGTEVLPEAELKFFMIASAEVRAKRRYLQDPSVDMATLAKEIELRDKMDMEREISPLRPAEDACIIDTSNMTQTEVADFICSKLKRLDREPELEK